MVDGGWWMGLGGGTSTLYIALTIPSSSVLPRLAYQPQHLLVLHFVIREAHSGRGLPVPPRPRVRMVNGGWGMVDGFGWRYVHALRVWLDCGACLFVLVSVPWGIGAGFFKLVVVWYWGGGTKDFFLHLFGLWLFSVITTTVCSRGRDCTPGAYGNSGNVGGSTCGYYTSTGYPDCGIREGWSSGAPIRYASGGGGWTGFVGRGFGSFYGGVFGGGDLVVRGDGNFFAITLLGFGVSWCHSCRGNRAILVRRASLHRLRQLRVLLSELLRIVEL